MPRTAANGKTTLATRFRRTFYDLRTEGAGHGREAVAIAVGVFLGCLPFYGFHLLMCWAVGALFRLNRLKMYLAANISNPFVAPWLLLAELQTGALIRRGSLLAISPHAIRSIGLGAVGLDLVVGSLIVGGVLGVIAGSATYLSRRAPTGDSGFVELVRRASDRYVGTSITAWEFARGKLWNDPLYRATLFGALLPSGGTLLDVGCGQGLALALLAEARLVLDDGSWPSSSPIPPRFDRMVGIEIRRRIADIARAALQDDADVVHCDARELPAGGARAVLLFDVLHLLDAAGQETMLANLAKTLDREGVLLVRDADAAGGWRFLVVRIGNRLKAIAVGVRGQRFCFRTRAEWLECFARHGFDAEVRPMGAGTPFANLLFRLTVKPAATGSSRRHEPPGRSAG
jgi:uncharacterized protein (DUF2062 family)/SAM-dependent methyltransferase